MSDRWGLAGRGGWLLGKLAHYQRRLADGDTVPRAQIIWLVDLHAIDVCAVGTAQVSQENLFVSHFHCDVFPGYLFIGNNQIHFAPSH